MDERRMRRRGVSGMCRWSSSPARVQWSRPTIAAETAATNMNTIHAPVITTTPDYFVARIKLVKSGKHARLRELIRDGDLL